jgi:hypothetical protein
MRYWTAYGMMILACWFPLANTLFSQTPTSFSTCDLMVDAGPDTNVCFPGGIVGLMGSITGILFFSNGFQLQD